MRPDYQKIAGRFFVLDKLDSTDIFNAKFNIYGFFMYHYL